MIAYGTTLVIFPWRFGLTRNFEPVNQSVMLGATIIPGGGQLVMIILLTCAALFLTATFFHFSFWRINLRSASDDVKSDRESSDRRRLNRYSLPFWKIFVPSLFVSLVPTWQWIWQVGDSWGKNNIYPVVDDERRVALTQRIVSAMYTYYIDLFGELVDNSVVWSAVAISIFILYLCARSHWRPRPTKGEYLLLGILFAALVVPTGDLFAGFMIPIPFTIACLIVGFILRGQVGSIC